MSVQQPNASQQIIERALLARDRILQKLQLVLQRPGLGQHALSLLYLTLQQILGLNALPRQRGSDGLQTQTQRFERLHGMQARNVLRP